MPRLILRYFKWLFFCLYIVSGKLAYGYHPNTSLGIARQAAIKAHLNQVLLDTFDLSEGLLHPLTQRSSEQQRWAWDWLSEGARLASFHKEVHYLNVQTGQGLQCLSTRCPNQSLYYPFEPLLWSPPVRITNSGSTFFMPVTQWIYHSKNPLNLSQWHEHYKNAILSAGPEQRQQSTIELLLRSGALIAALADMGDPNYVQNDYEELKTNHAAYATYVWNRFGSGALPLPLETLPFDEKFVSIPQLFVNPTQPGSGLAERTAGKFFSYGTLPGQPGFERFGFRIPVEKLTSTQGYLASSHYAQVPHWLGWSKPQGQVTWFFLDHRSYEEYAQVLLPQVQRYAIIALNLLFHPYLQVEAMESKPAMIKIHPWVKQGTLTWIVEDNAGQRRILTARQLVTNPGSLQFEDIPMPLPIGKKIIVLLQGQDIHGQPIISAVVKPNQMVEVPAGVLTWTKSSPVDKTKPSETFQLNIPAFRIDRTEVTVRDFQACVASNQCRAPEKTFKDNRFCNYNQPGKEDHPINCINLKEAAGYCQALHKKLPTEQQWEYAAKGSEGSDYPWGNTLPDNTKACYSRYTDDNTWLGSCPVASFPATFLGRPVFNKQGIFDLAGNLAEWTQSVFQKERSDSSPLCTDQMQCVIKGGSVNDKTVDKLTTTARTGLYAGYQLFEVGFRCVDSL